ncbi:hypothetical protein KO498_12925 [Lentibacter algarum]|uniref:hypothetical protein n=1 Tax=Lentibacter algarum TaxID=576131 RepID=UPI001C0A6210|nr:hypothetical protein [Lentibacter algarum]MBU2982712.1 hypothetical protein [Lentibacter algarum]
MYGVVLWSDTIDKKAVIWCEDHGDLAYYVGSETSIFDGPQLDAGDLVHFQVSDGEQMRLAQNPELVSECHAPALAKNLRAVMDDASSQQAAPVRAPVDRAQNVVPFRLSCTA